MSDSTADEGRYHVEHLGGDLYRLRAPAEAVLTKDEMIDLSLKLCSASVNMDTGWCLPERSTH